MKRVPVKMKPRVIVFGTGQGGQTAMKRLSGLCQVVAVIDNNPDNHGRRFGRVRVSAPEEVIRFKFDWICLASIFREEMAGQLLQLGVPFDRLRDGSASKWDRSGFPPPLSDMGGRRAVLVGPSLICRRSAKLLGAYLDIVGIRASDTDTASPECGEADLFIIASTNPCFEIDLLMAEGVPLDQIELLAPEFIATRPGIP